MRRTILFSLVLVLLSSFLSACGSASGPEKTVEAYLNALVAKDADRLTALSCADWEGDAITELDSFQGVEARIEGLSCAQTGTEGDTALVGCSGKIIATYGNEDQELDLSTRTYSLVQQGGEWLVCGAQ